MPHRIFRDQLGRQWQAWTVTPTSAERRVRTVAAPGSAVDRRRRDEARVNIGPRWAHGWLAFETRGEKRRLAPYPDHWLQMSDDELQDLCASATQVAPSRRLVE
jgi:hypothetical protein